MKLPLRSAHPTVALPRDSPSCTQPRSDRPPGSIALPTPSHPFAKRVVQLFPFRLTTVAPFDPGSLWLLSCRWDEGLGSRSILHERKAQVAVGRSKGSATSGDRRSPEKTEARPGMHSGSNRTEAGQMETHTPR